MASNLELDINWVIFMESFPTNFTACHILDIYAITIMGLHAGSPGDLFD